MPRQSFFSEFIIKILQKNFSVAERKDFELGKPKNILIVRQHNQFGDMLASVPLFRAIKEKYSESLVTLIASPENFFAVEKNDFIDSLFVFNKKKLFNPLYLFRLIKLLKKEYDVVIVPATVAISNTSCILAAISNSKIKIGPLSLNGKENKLSFLFHYRISLDWRKNPDMHVSDFILDIVRPFGISTQNFISHIKITEEDEKRVNEFISSMDLCDNELLIGLHIGAGKPQNRWPLNNFIELINKLHKKYKVKIYLTGSNADWNEIKYIKENLKVNVNYFINKPISQLAALISKSSLFITNDTGVMHVAGVTKTPQISLFGPTNPFNWAPLGNNKFFIRKSDLISDIAVDDVFKLCEQILEQNKK
ncbi:MAG: glycosyltransferase family 9 protein [Melioribacter sp.]|nr:glycosyltransferase family 9 protein [Melioribacter sp.]